MTPPSPFRGLSAFPITPADSAGRVDVGALQALLERLAQAGVDSIGLLGSTGSYPYLARAERRRAVEAAVAQVAGRAPVMVGIGALRTDDAIEHGRNAAAAGADAVLLAPVSYAPLTDDEVFEHFRAVAAAVDRPLCIYDNPSTTHFSVSPALVARLARLPNVVAAKSPASGAAEIAGQLAALRPGVPAGFALGCSVDWNATEAMLAGADAWYSVAAGLFPEPCLRIVRAAQAGDAAEARRLNARMQPLWALFTAHSSLRVMYAAANLLGLVRAAPPRPILPLPEAAQQQVRAVLDELGLR